MHPPIPTSPPPHKGKTSTQTGAALPLDYTHPPLFLREASSCKSTHMNLPDGKEDGALPAKVTAAEHPRAADAGGARGAPHPDVPSARNTSRKKERNLQLMESQLRAARPSISHSSFAFLLLTFYFTLLRLGPDGADQRLVGNSAACHCAPTHPPHPSSSSPPPSYLLAGQRGGGLGADWQSLCSPSKTLKVDFTPMKNPLKDAFFLKKMKPTGNKRKSAVKKREHHAIVVLIIC